MKITSIFNLRRILLAAAFLTALGFGGYTRAQESEHIYLFDLNNRKVRSWVDWEGITTMLMTLTIPGRWWAALGRVPS